MATAPLQDAALGLLETLGLVAAIEGTDAMLKAAEVRLLHQEQTVPALITSTIVGETAAVRAAIDAGRAAAERVGKVVSAHVIPRPAPDVWPIVAAPDATVPPSSRHDADEGLADKTVPELRKLARSRDDESFSGRAISRATKETLLRFLRTGEA